MSAGPTKRTRHGRQGSNTNVELQEPIHNGDISMQLQPITEAEGEMAQVPAAEDVPSFQSASSKVRKQVQNRRKQNAKARGARAQASQAQQQQQLASAALDQQGPAPTAAMTENPAQPAQDVGTQAGRDLPDLPLPIDPHLSEAQTEPKRSMYDAQSGVERLTFDDSQPLQVQDPPSQILPAEALPTQDVGYKSEVPRQPIKKPRGRPPRTASSQNPESEYNRQNDAGEESEKEPSPPRGTPPASNYAQVQQQAKLFAATLRKDKVPQKRKAWTLVECDALIDGIGRFGNAYAPLKSDDARHQNILADRSAEDLRHKARNMKFDYLKAGIQLPEGFENVLLDRKFQDKLAAMGREYHQVQMRASKRQKNKQDSEATPENPTSLE